LRQQETYRNIQIHLNELLARDVDAEFSVIDTFIIEHDMDYKALASKAEALNPDLQAAIVNHRLQQLELKYVRGARYPVVSVTSAYTRSRSESAFGFSTQSNVNGFNYGVTASVNIFNGFLQRRAERNAELAIDQAELQVSKVRGNIEAQLRAAYQTYLTSLELVRLESSNTRIAKENLDITLEKFKLGSIAPVDFREAQRNCVDASARYSTAH